MTSEIEVSFFATLSTAVILDVLVSFCITCLRVSWPEITVTCLQILGELSCRGSWMYSERDAACFSFLHVSSVQSSLHIA